MTKQHKEGGTLAAAKQVIVPAHEHGGERDFMVTAAELRDPNYDTAPLRAWLGEDWIANGYRVISEYRVAIAHNITDGTPVQPTNQPILESA